VIFKVLVNEAESKDKWLGINQDLKGMTLNPEELEEGVYVIKI